MSDDFDSMMRHHDDRCHQSAMGAGYGEDLDEYEIYCDGWDAGVATIEQQLSTLRGEVMEYLRDSNLASREALRRAALRGKDK